MARRNAWDHLPIPLAAGEDFSAVDLARKPPALDSAQNWVLDRPGGLFPRPGAIRHAGRWGVRGLSGARVMLLDVGVTYSANLAATGFVGRSLVGLRGPAGETPAVLTNGRAFVLGGPDWMDSFGFWSVRLRRLGSVNADQNPEDPYSLGAVGVLGEGPILTDQGDVLGADGQVIGRETVALGEQDRCPVMFGTNPGVLFNDTGTANLIMGILDVGDVPNLVRTTIATNHSQLSGQGVWGVWDPVTSHVYLVFSTNTTGQARVEKRTAAGALVSNQTLTTPGSSPCRSVSIAVVDGAVVVAVGMASGSVYSKVYNTSLADQALDVTLATTGIGEARNVAVGPGRTTGEAVLSYHDSSFFTLDVAQRSTTAATGAIFFTLRGTSTGGGAAVDGVKWRTKYAPFRVNGRCLVGVSWGVSTSTRDWSWAVIDVNSVDVNGLGITPVAAGEQNSSVQPDRPVPADAAANGRPLLGSAEFTIFNSSGGTDLATTVYQFSTTGQVPVEEALGAWYLGGSVPYQYDGAHFAEASFLARPYLEVNNPAGGALAAGSYTVAAVWRWVDYLGRVHRSAPSNIVTITVVANDQLECFITNNQLTQRRSSTSSAVEDAPVIELYVVGPNPAQGADLTLQTTAVMTTTAARTNVNLTFVTTSGERLYTGGGIMDNNPPRLGAAGGLVAAGARLWAAGGRVVAASKFLKEGQGVAWNDALEVALPAGTGDVVALVPDNDRVIALCERGVYLVGGPGLDDLGRGPGFAEPQRVSDVGCAGARSWCRTPVGVVYQTPDRSVVVLTDQGSVRVSRSVEEGGPLLAPAAHLVHWPEQEAVVLVQATAGSSTTAPVLVWYYRTGQWVRWVDRTSLLVGSSAALIDGVPWVLDAVNSQVVHFDGAIGLDNVDGTERNYITAFTTPAVRISEGRLRGVGRCAKVALAGRPEAVNTTVTGSLTVQHDDAVTNNGDGAVQTTAFTVRRDDPMTSAQTSWPVARMLPEFTLLRRRCSTVRVGATFDPGVVSLVELELDVQTTAESAPPAPGQRF